MQTASKTYGTKHCANNNCSNVFEVRRVNMIYCSNSCCREATNAKLIARYHDKKKVQTKDRKCACGARLSRYNKSERCHACQIKTENQRRVELLGQLGIEYIDEDAPL